MGTYNYKDLKGSHKRQEEEAEAKNGRLPEGIYKFALGMAVKDAEQTSKLTKWVLKCKILKPGTIYHQVERQLTFRTATDYYARQSMAELIEFLDTLGMNWDWIKILSDNDPTDIDGEKAMLAVLSYVADQKLRLDVSVEDQEDSEGKVSKYQKFTIQTKDLQPINWDPFLQENGIEGDMSGGGSGEVGDENLQDDPPPPPPQSPPKARNPFVKKA